MMKENKMNFKATLNSDYQYSYNNDIASLWIYMDNFTGGAHGMYWLDSYTFNIDNGEIYSFKDLFIENSSGVSLVEGRILKEVENIEKVVTHSRDFSRELVTTYVAHKTAKI